VHQRYRHSSVFGTFVTPKIFTVCILDDPPFFNTSGELRGIFAEVSLKIVLSSTGRNHVSRRSTNETWYRQCNIAGSCNRKIAGSIPFFGHSVTPFSKEFNLAMLTIVGLATNTAALRAAWDICCAYINMLCFGFWTMRQYYYTAHCAQVLHLDIES